MLRTQVRWIEIVSAKDTLIRSDKLDISRRVLVNLNVSNSVVIQTSRNPLNQQLGAMPGWLTSWKRGTSSVWRKVRIPRSDLALLMVVWCVFGLFELALQVFVPRSAIRIEDLPPGARFFLFCYSLTVLAFFLLWIAC
jgi:hypothetical protein